MVIIPASELDVVVPRPSARCAPAALLWRWDKERSRFEKEKVNFMNFESSDKMLLIFCWMLLDFLGDSRVQHIFSRYFISSINQLLPYFVGFCCPQIHLCWRCPGHRVGLFWGFSLGSADLRIWGQRRCCSSRPGDVSPPKSQGWSFSHDGDEP